VAGGIPPPLVFIAGLAAGVIINIFLLLWIWRSPWNFVVGGVFVIPAVWLSVEASRAFRRHNTPTEPWKPTSQLVEDGPYRFTRNPIYLSFAIAYVGLAFIFNSVPAIVLLVPLIIGFDRTQVQREERYLEGKFGEEYRRYKEKVRRWI
jgi:protein-S-isoprenylcysteine O-methyltransferase Ste14